MKEKELYELKCHELLHDVDSFAEGQFTALRVPGGWIYTHWRSGRQQPVFVPFDNEFMPRTISPNPTQCKHGEFAISCDICEPETKEKV